MFAWAIAGAELRTASVPQPFSAFGLSPVHLRPDGRGTVRLKAADPLAAPEIRFNFLKSANDCQALIQGMRIWRARSRQAAGAEALRRRGDPARRRGRTDEPSSSSRDPRARRLEPASGRHLPHGARGRRGGRSAAPGHGIEGLRVADASIMPQVAGRQHQRAVDHDRREMRRDDIGGRTGGVMTFRASLQQELSCDDANSYRP